MALKGRVAEAQLESVLRIENPLRLYQPGDHLGGAAGERLLLEASPRVIEALAYNWIVCDKQTLLHARQSVFNRKAERCFARRACQRWLQNSFRPHAF